MTKRIRGFEKISIKEYNKHITNLDYNDLTLPKRGSSKSAGYDFISTVDFDLNPGESIIIPSGIKSYMQDTEWLMGASRSGIGFNYEVQFANIPPVIDADYYDNIKNEGHIMFKLVNRGNKVWKVKAGERIVQCLFLPYLLADEDKTSEGNIRQGGIQSTGK